MCCLNFSLKLKTSEKRTMASQYEVYFSMYTQSVGNKGRERERVYVFEKFN